MSIVHRTDVIIKQLVKLAHILLCYANINNFCQQIMFSFGLTTIEELANTRINSRFIERLPSDAPKIGRHGTIYTDLLRTMTSYIK